MNQTKHFTAEWVTSRMDRRYMIVAEKDGKVVGTGSFDEGEMKAIYVDPNYERQGIGRQIMDDLEGYAQSQGYDRVHLGSSKTAIDFY